MSSFRPVEEKDFRQERFRDADPKDYEFREDGEILRKDRWETGIQRIRAILGIREDWEIGDVVEAVRKLHVNSSTRT